MKNLAPIFLLLVLGGCIANAQVKVGENPQTIDATSVLELESSTRALVITRVDQAEMIAMQPLRGALVYNTEAQCIFFFDSTQWINLCATGENTTNVSLELNNNELVLTDSEGNTVNLTLEQAIGTAALQNDAVTLTKIDQNGATDGQIIKWDDASGAWVIGDDESGIAAITDILSTEANNAIIDNNGLFYDDSLLEQTITDHITDDQDLDDSNELQDLQFDSTTNILTLTNPATPTNAVNLSGLLGPTDTDTDDGLSDYNANTGYDINVDGTSVGISASDALEVVDDGITTIKINNGAVTPVKIAPSPTNGQVLTTDGAGDVVWATPDAFQNLATDDLVQDSENRSYDLNGNNLVFLDNSGATILGNVGIGNGAATPQNKLHVSGAGRFEGLLNSDGTVGEPAYRFAGDTDTGLFVSAADLMGFSAGGTLALEVSEPTDGNALVTVAQTLELEEDLVDINGDTGTADQVLSSLGAGNGVAWIDAPSGVPTLTEGSIIFAGPTTLTENNAALFWDNANTVVGIGTNTPNSGLGTQLHLSQPGQNELQFPLRLQNRANNIAGGSATGILFSVEDGGDFGKGALVYERLEGFGRGSFHFLQEPQGSSSNPNLFFDNNIAMTITNAGDDVDNSGTPDGISRVGIGTRTPTEQLHITENFRIEGAVLDGTNTSGTAGQVLSSTGTGVQWITNTAAPVRGAQVAITAANNGTGEYTVADTAVTASSVIQLTVTENVPGNPIMIQLKSQTAGSFTVQIYEFSGATPAGTNANWSYTIFNP
ncbi:MAG: hypothetical protein AAGF77_05490 [Bacteroidota bacterium]